MATAKTSQHSDDLPTNAESCSAKTPGAKMLKYELSPSPTPQRQPSRSPTVDNYDGGKLKAATRKRTSKAQSLRKRSTPTTKASVIGKTSTGSRTAPTTQPKPARSTPRSSTWTADQKTFVMERVVSAGVSAINAAELAVEAGLTVTQIKNALQKGRSGNLRDRAVRSATA